MGARHFVSSSLGSPRATEPPRSKGKRGGWEDCAHPAGCHISMQSMLHGSCVGAVQTPWNFSLTLLFSMRQIPVPVKVQVPPPFTQTPL